MSPGLAGSVVLCLPMCQCCGGLVRCTQRQGKKRLPALVVHNTSTCPARRDQRLALAVVLAASQAAGRVLEHGRSSDAALTTRMLGSLAFLLGELVLHCGTCHEILPAAPRALETLVAAMQQLQAGRAGQVGWAGVWNLGWG